MRAIHLTQYNNWCSNKTRRGTLREGAAYYRESEGGESSSLSPMMLQQDYFAEGSNRSETAPSRETAPPDLGMSEEVIACEF